MSDGRNHDLSERLIDLCSDHAMGLHEASDLNELDRLDPDQSAREAFEAIAAELDIAYADADPIDMPAGLEARLLASVPTRVDAPAPLKFTSAAVPVGSEQIQSPRGVWFPWLVAAACVVVTGLVVLRPQPGAPVLPSAAESRDALLAKHADDQGLLRYAWTPTEDPSVVGAVTGELIWDESTDEGYMTIGGLEVNDPSEFQYQLWIFDATRPLGELPQFAGPFNDLLTQRPIDGGVFDITQSGEVVIPINAKLMVQQGVAFAVTVERPGGVVVSDRSRVPLLAIPG
ncbi:MAG: anti-sigma factor [Phycisphaerales bacterium]|nr:anti-sigma factor [Phycisphaerales bacterium]